LSVCGRSQLPSDLSIAFEGPQTDKALAFRHYNPDEMVDGQSMSAHMRFSIAYWHSFEARDRTRFGPGTIQRPWEKGTDAVSIAKIRMDAAFEFFQKNPCAVLVFPRPRHRTGGQNPRRIQSQSRAAGRPRVRPPEGDWRQAALGHRQSFQ